MGGGCECVDLRNFSLLFSCRKNSRVSVKSVAYQGILFGGGEGSTNSVEDRGQRERGSGGR
jgi:hypothetical protein